MSQTKGSRPPRWPMWLLQRLCNEHQLEILYGDVQEVYWERLQESGKLKATLLFYRDALSLLRPFVLKRVHEYHPSLNFLQMLSIYLKTGVRSLRKNAMSSGINLFGLLIGMTAVLIIAHYAFFELSYDKFHNEHQQIYRLAHERQVNNETVFHGATTFLPVGPELKASSPEVLEQVRFYYPFTHGVINYEQQSYVEEKPTFVDPSYFTVFNFQLRLGNRANALTGPNKVLLTERLAQRYFGNTNPLGKTIEFTFEDGSTELEVTGVMEDPRADSHLQLDMLISFATLDQWPAFERSAWFLPFYHTYVLTTHDFDPVNLEQKAASLISEKAQGNTQRNITELVHLQALMDIHLDSDLMFELGENGDRQAVYFLLLVAILILIIAYLNYINLSTAMAIRRAREVGVRKVMGSTRKQLIHQFLTESFLLNLGSLLGAIALTILFLPVVSRLMGISFFLIRDPLFWTGALLLTSLGAVLSGLYPALVLSGYKAVWVLKGRFAHGVKGVNLRRALVSLQFIISIVMIGATLMLFKQTNFLINKDPGFEASKILVVNAPRNLTDPMQYQARVGNFANAINAIPTVNAFTHSASVPGKVMGSGSFKRSGDAEAESVTLQMNAVDYDFFATYELGFKAGRAFSRSLETDRQSLILNQAALEVLGIANEEAALQSKVEALGRKFNILGVIENYHHSSLKTRFEPIAFILSPGRTIYFSINMDTQDLPKTLEMIEKEMKAQFPKSPFDYFFLEDSFDDQFESDIRLMAMFRAFALLAVLLGSLGLFGLVSFVVNQRVKEIGVRKVLGATGFNILKVLSGSFNLPLIISSIVAMLALYFGGQEWLQGFPFRIDLNWMIFVLPLAIMLSLTLGIVACQTAQILRKNPVNSLRNE